VIKTSDWIIDLGPEGGSAGGTVVAEGTPEDVAAVPESYTGKFLSEVLQATPAKPASTRRRRKVSA
jgi:excinuclease ABC subunit A